jgi:glycosyltransferase involved in cell wall biosynthesis
VLTDAESVLQQIGVPCEIIVVDDCSSDATARLAEGKGVKVLRNIQNGGYGYSLMRGVTAAQYPTVAIIDADGSYPVEDFARLFAEYRRGFAMVVGNRQGVQYDGSNKMRALRWAFRALTQFIVGKSVPDVNSGMRIFDRAIVLPLFPHMSYGFSFTTSITLLFMMRALPVSYVPVAYRKRHGESKVRYFRDSLRALQIVTSITARLNPIKLFLLAAGVNAALMLPVVLLLSLWGDARALLVLVLETSAILVGLGFVVEALVDKRPLR